MWLVIFYYFFTKRKEKKRKQKNNKILPATSACCGAVVRNECKDHFSCQNVFLFFVISFEREMIPTLISHNSPTTS
jgi:hypothetical protein